LSQWDWPPKGQGNFGSGTDNIGNGALNLPQPLFTKREEAFLTKRKTAIGRFFILLNGGLASYQSGRQAEGARKGGARPPKRLKL